MAYPKEESAKFAQLSTQVMGEFEQGRDKILDTSAARGFGAPSGDAVMDLFELGQKSKAKLAEGNGKIYAERRGILFGQQEFAYKAIVEAAKLGMELYRQEILDALEVEAAEEDAFFSRGKADVERLNAQTEARQIAIIQAKAIIEYDIAKFKQQLAVAERVTLGAERNLIYAQLATAEKKLEIIYSIYQVLAAEKLVLVAEQQKVVALQLALAAEKITAQVKKEMIPFYIDKASAKTDLAAATMVEIPVLKAIEELGFGRIYLKDAEMSAEHIIRIAEENEELARRDYTRASSAADIARINSRIAVTNAAASSEVQAGNLRSAARAGEAVLRAQSHGEQVVQGLDADAAIATHEVTNITSELAAILAGLSTRAGLHAAAITASATQNVETNTTAVAADVLQLIIGSGG